MKQDTNTAKDYKCGFFNGNKLFNKYLINFTGNDNALVEKMKKIKLKDYDLEKIYFAANKLDTPENMAIKQYIIDKLKNATDIDKSIATTVIINIATKTNDNNLQKKLSERLNEELKNHNTRISSALLLCELAVKTKDKDLQKKITDTLIEKANDRSLNETINKYLHSLGTNITDGDIQKKIVNRIITNNKDFPPKNVPDQAAYYETLGDIGANTKNKNLQDDILTELFEKSCFENANRLQNAIYESLGNIGANTIDEYSQNTIVKKLIDTVYDSNSLSNTRAKVYTGLGKIGANTKNNDIKSKITNELIKSVQSEKNITERTGKNNEEAKVSLCKALAGLWTNIKDKPEKDKVYNEVANMKGFNYKGLGYIGINTKNIDLKNEIIDKLEKINLDCKLPFILWLNEIVKNTDNEPFKRQIADKLINIADKSKLPSFDNLYYFNERHSKEYDINNVIKNNDDFNLITFSNALQGPNADRTLLSLAGFINENISSLETLANIGANTTNKELQREIVNKIQNNPLFSEKPAIIQLEKDKALGKIGMNAQDENLTKEIFNDLINNIEKIYADKPDIALNIKKVRNYKPITLKMEKIDDYNPDIDLKMEKVKDYKPITLKMEKIDDYNPDIALNIRIKEFNDYKPITLKMEKIDDYNPDIALKMEKVEDYKPITLKMEKIDDYNPDIDLKMEKVEDYKPITLKMEKIDDYNPDIALNIRIKEFKDYKPIILKMEKNDDYKSNTIAVIIDSLKNIALKKGYLKTDETLKGEDGKEIIVDNKPAFNIIRRKVLEKVKDIKDLTENKDIFTRALVAQKELEEHEDRDNKLLGLLAKMHQKVDDPERALQVFAQSMSQEGRGSTG